MFSPIKGMKDDAKRRELKARRKNTRKQLEEAFKMGALKGLPKSNDIKR